MCVLTNNYSAHGPVSTSITSGSVMRGKPKVTASMSSHGQVRTVSGVVGSDSPSI